MTARLFEPDSAMWRLNRERFVLLGGSAAAILQAAHPTVALGVAAHSRFRDDVFGRLHRTLDAVYAIAFGTGAHVAATTKSIGAIHARVKGDTPQPYSAFDPDAQMWVLATLVMTTVEMHRRVGRPPPAEELERFYADMRVFGRCFGLDPAVGPQTWSAFTGYYEEMLAGPLLGSHASCAEVAQAIAVPERPLVARLVGPLLMPLACDYVPEPVRSRLGLPWRPWHRRATRVMERCVGLGLPVAPAAIRFARAYRRARRDAPHRTVLGRRPPLEQAMPVRPIDWR
jgi:uncharacterized protein (DUF2236 family)